MFRDGLSFLILYTITVYLLVDLFAQTISHSLIYTTGLVSNIFPEKTKISNDVEVKMRGVK